MEQECSVVAGNFAASFSLKFLNVFVHTSVSIEPITLIWVSLERSFPPAKLEFTWCQRWWRQKGKKGQRSWPVTGGTGVNGLKLKLVQPRMIYFISAGQSSYFLVQWKFYFGRSVFVVYLSHTGKEQFREFPQISTMNKWTLYTFFLQWQWQKF